MQDPMFRDELQPIEIAIDEKIQAKYNLEKNLACSQSLAHQMSLELS